MSLRPSIARFRGEENPVMVAAFSVWALLFGMGLLLLVFGPLLAGVAMDLVGVNGFLLLLGVVLIALAGFAQARARRRPAPLVGEPSQFTPSPQATPALSPAYVETGTEAHTADAGNAPPGHERE